MIIVESVACCQELLLEFDPYVLLTATITHPEADTTPFCVRLSRDKVSLLEVKIDHRSGALRSVALVAIAPEHIRETTRPPQSAEIEVLGVPVICLNEWESMDEQLASRFVDVPAPSFEMCIGPDYVTLSLSDSPSIRHIKNGHLRLGISAKNSISSFDFIELDENQIGTLRDGVQFRRSWSDGVSLSG